MTGSNNLKENIIYGIFLVLGLITVGFVLLISVYLIIAGLPAIREIGLIDFLFGTTWASTAAEPKFGILPFILTSVYGTAGAVIIAIPVGFFTAVYVSKIAPKWVRTWVTGAVNLLAGIPSVVYGLVGMMVLIPGIRIVFDVPDGATLLAAIIVLSIMILPYIISVSVTSLDAVPKSYEDASLALGANHIETYFRGRNHGVRKRCEHAWHLRERAFPYLSGCERDVIFLRTPEGGAVLHCAGPLPVHHAHQCLPELLHQEGPEASLSQIAASGGGESEY